ncbi:MAG: TrkH family potassium uptake protein [Alphaproteobacteria bacterium]
MNLQPVAFILGYLIGALAVAMAVTAAASLAMGDGEWPAFSVSSGLCIFVSGLLILGMRQREIIIDRRQGFLLTSMAWTVVPFLGALPLIWSSRQMSLTDAVFESVSGLTTTGSTVLTGLDVLEPSLLLWRSMLQWLGGIGIIAMGVTVLPFLRVGGLQLFRTESSDRSDKVVARASQFTSLLIGTYAVLSLLCALAYAAAGMSAFDAINHAMTTISTGGYSTHDASIGYFQSPVIDWIATLFMLSGALPFVLYVQAVRGRPLQVFTDSQVLTLVALLAGSSLVMSVWLWSGSDIAWIDAIRLTAFNLTSVVTTTGFATADYTLWGTFAVVVFLFFTFVGGCAGSTSGGFKIYRFLIVGQMFRATTHRMITPHGVYIATYGGRPIDLEIVKSVATFMIAFFTTILLLTMALGMLGLDFQTAFSGAATAVANVGPGIGQTIGPAGNFAPLPDAAKWLLSFGMLLGRLEIVTLAVLLMPDFWRR